MVAMERRTGTIGAKVGLWFLEGLYIYIRKTQNKKKGGHPPLRSDRTPIKLYLTEKSS